MKSNSNSNSNSSLSQNSFNLFVSIDTDRRFSSIRFSHNKIKVFIFIFILVKVFFRRIVPSRFLLLAKDLKPPIYLFFPTFLLASTIWETYDANTRESIKFNLGSSEPAKKNIKKEKKKINNEMFKTKHAFRFLHRNASII